MCNPMGGGSFHGGGGQMPANIRAMRHDGIKGNYKAAVSDWRQNGAAGGGTTPPPQTNPWQDWRTSLDTWRQSRPPHPEGGLHDPTARDAFHTAMQTWRTSRPSRPEGMPGWHGGGATPPATTPPAGGNWMDHFDGERSGFGGFINGLRHIGQMFTGEGGEGLGGLMQKLAERFQS